MSHLSLEEMETAYDLIAESIDQVGQEQESLFLSKLAFTLAYKLGDLDEIKEAISITTR